MKGVDKANELRLRAFNVTERPRQGQLPDPRLRRRRTGRRLHRRAAGELQGRASGFAVGAAKNAKGAVASVDDVIVRGPNPF